MNVLVLNAGSSSLKFQLIVTDQARIDAGSDVRLAWGQLERAGTGGVLTLNGNGREFLPEVVPTFGIASAVKHVLELLSRAGLGPIDAVGHRIVHGGERFTRSTRLNEEVLRQLDATLDLAPLHNPQCLECVRTSRAVLGPAIPHIGAFDTAFHHTLPEAAYLYAIPYAFYERHHVRRYGFHGTSHRYVAHRYRQLTGRTRAETNLVTLHLGNGCSACAIKRGDSIDTSMGLTPLEGLVMGTRSGDIDPAIVGYLARKTGLILEKVEDYLNKQSGLLGLSGTSSDMRELLERTTERQEPAAERAVALFCYRVRKYIGAYLAAMNGADALVFTGGIGEHAPVIRERICDELGWLGVTLDPARNQDPSLREGRIDSRSGRLEVWVIPTNEELLIARDTYRVVEGLELHY